MSWQEKTKDDREVAKIVDKMLMDYSNDNVEILVYLEGDKWTITKDRKFFSLGYKLEDVIAVQEDEIKNLQNEIASLKTTIGQLHMQIMSQQGGMCHVCKYPKWSCQCFIPGIDFNKLTCE